MHNLGAQFRRLEQDSQEVSRLLLEEEELRNEIARLSAKNEVLSTVPRISASDRDQPERDVLAEAMIRMMRQPTLSDALESIDLLYGDRVEILPSAKASAEESNEFQYPAKAMKLLVTLATEYWEAIAGNRGDTDARKVFGTGGYAAKESGTLSKDGTKRRTFDRSGIPVLMEKHLKIGTADNASDTLRIHFEWSAQDRKIVIGHCGRHLDF